jgi:hypothetical protein
MSRNISEKERSELIAYYLGEKRKLTVQLDHLRRILGELQGEPSSDDALPVKRGPGRPRKDPATELTGVPRRRGRPRLTAEEKAARRAAKGQFTEVKQRKERKLNGWDELVLKGIKSKDQFLRKSDLVSLGHSQHPEMTEDAASIKVSATLQKLSKKGLIAKHHTGIGRGDYYGLASWLDKRGKLTDEGREKLVIKTKNSD